MPNGSAHFMIHPSSDSIKAFLRYSLNIRFAIAKSIIPLYTIRAFVNQKALSVKNLLDMCPPHLPAEACDLRGTVSGPILALGLVGISGGYNFIVVPGMYAR
jgi:hypothetical protein